MNSNALGNWLHKKKKPSLVLDQIRLFKSFDYAIRLNTATSLYVLSYSPTLNWMFLTFGIISTLCWSRTCSDFKVQVRMSHLLLSTRKLVIFLYVATSMPLMLDYLVFEYMNEIDLRGSLGSIQIELFKPFIFLNQVDLQPDNLMNFFHLLGIEWTVYLANCSEVRISGKEASMLGKLPRRMIIQTRTFVYLPIGLTTK